MASSNLHNAKSAKNDEFYTQLADIEKELEHYSGYFKDEVVYCNCDDPQFSNFFQYFKMHFEYLGLKKLIVTCYKKKFDALFDFKDDISDPTTEAVIYSGKGQIKITTLKGEGDFRSDEAIKLLKQATIVVTNPPFSLFREYMAQLMEHNKKFIILGSINAVTYKEIFPLIKNNEVWFGINTGAKSFISAKSKELTNFGNIIWYTNLPHKKRNEEVFLSKKYNKKDYLKYDNYDAIEVSKVVNIPRDYDGAMGVPISFLDKHNPNQFEILGLTQRGCHGDFPDTRRYDDYIEISKKTGKPTGCKGSKSNENAVMEGIDPTKNHLTNGKRQVYSLYKRVFIKKKEVQI